MRGLMAPGGLMAPTDEMRRNSWNYWRHGRRWIIWGIIATVIPVAILYVMVSKP